MSAWEYKRPSPEVDKRIRSTYKIAADLATPIYEALCQLPHSVAVAAIRNLDEILGTVSDELLGCDQACEMCEEPIFGVDLDEGAGMSGDCWVCAECMKAGREAYLKEAYLKGVSDGVLDPETGEPFEDDAARTEAEGTTQPSPSEAVLEQNFNPPIKDDSPSQAGRDA